MLCSIFTIAESHALICMNASTQTRAQHHLKTHILTTVTKVTKEESNSTESELESNPRKESEAAHIGVMEGAEHTLEMKLKNFIDRPLGMCEGLRNQEC